MTNTALSCVSLHTLYVLAGYSEDIFQHHEALTVVTGQEVWVKWNEFHILLTTHYAHLHFNFNK